MSNAEPKPKILVDSREQAPLTFNKELFNVVREGVPFGDYWLDLNGFQIPIAFERKSVGDLYGTMGKGYDRFKREMERAKEAKFHLILVIEGSITEVGRGYKHSSIKGESMLKKLATLRIRYDLEVLFFDGRKEMTRWIEEVFHAIYRNYTKS